MPKFPKFVFSLNFLYIILIAAQVAAIIFLCVYIPSTLPVALALAAIWILDGVCACILFSRKGAPEVKCVWFLLIAALPVVGAIIYLFASSGKKNCGSLKTESDGAIGLGKAACALCGTAEAGYEKAEYFPDGESFFTAAIKEIENAKKCVYIEFFIIERGNLFERVLAALKKAKAAGAEIKIISDGVGSAFRLRKKDIKRLKSEGIEVKIFHRITPVPRAKLNLRDHRKIIAVDGRVAFTGGINLADEYINIDSPYGYWKDSGVAVYGEAAKIFEGMFLAMFEGSFEMPAPQRGRKNCLPIYDSPPCNSICEDAYVCGISSAEERIHLMTPYFCPSDKLLSALAFAARRGVDVKIIIPHIPDKKYAFEISKAYARTLSPCGVKFYEYTPGFMHAKNAVFDNKCFIGSYNFDFRSTHFNHECGVMFEGDICDEAEKDFLSCLELSAPFSEEKISPFKRFTIFILKIFSPLM